MKNNKGFSLIEVLVAMVILAIMTGPMLAAFASSAKINTNARRLEEANAIGQRVLERCKALTVDELLTGTVSTGDVVRNDATDSTGTLIGWDSITAYSLVTNSSTGVYSAKSKFNTITVDGTSQKQYMYNLSFASFTSGVADTEVVGDGASAVTVPYYLGTNSTKYYVQATLSPYDSDYDGNGTGTPYEVNTYSMPVFDEIKDSKNYVLLDEIYQYDSSIKSILPSRSAVANPASTDAFGNIIAREQTTTESTITKLSGIRKVCVLDVELSYDAATKKWTEKPVLTLKYYRYDAKLSDGTTDRYSVNNKGELIEHNEDGTTSTVESTSGEAFIKKHTLSEYEVDLTSGEFKDIYIFYTSYDKKYGGGSGTSEDSIYINVDVKNSPGAGDSNYITDEKKLSVFIPEQYIATNGSNITDKTAFREGTQVKLDRANVYINGTSAHGQKKLDGNGVKVYSDIDSWNELNEANGITQDYNESDDRHIYTITVKIWVESHGKAPDFTTEPFLTLTSTKDND
jgi:prepilin-type N-terminal cleavage/methylation domain-containing protein